MKLGQLLGRQSRTKIAIALAHDGQPRNTEPRARLLVGFGPHSLIGREGPVVCRFLDAGNNEALGTLS